MKRISRWFRVYDDMLHDPKIQTLTPDRFKTLVNIWCVASKHEGKLPELADLAYALRLHPDDLAQDLEYFVSKQLLDNERGKLVPHNWNTRQYKSDSSSARVVKHRKKRKQPERSNGDETFQ